jgi:hypothetical protein
MQNEDTNLEPKKPRGRPKGTGKKMLTKQEAEQLIRDVIHKITREHISFTQYQVWCRTTHDMSYHQCNKYWTKTWRLLKEKYQNDRDKLIDKQLHKLWELYEDAYIKGDFNVARAVLSDITKLQGLNEPEKVEITNKVIEVNFGTPSEDSSETLYPDQETE